jgi:hypothetical protein
MLNAGQYSENDVKLSSVAYTRDPEDTRVSFHVLQHLYYETTTNPRQVLFIPIQFTLMHTPFQVCYP